MNHSSICNLGVLGWIALTIETTHFFYFFDEDLKMYCGTAKGGARLADGS